MRLALAMLAGGLALAQSPSVDWSKQREEILRHHRSLIQIDSTNPPGNETRVVDYLRNVLQAEGIATKTFAMDPSRANLVARLKGNGRKRPLLLFAHTDTVGVQKEKWPVDPHGAVLKDGFIWGRGSLDDKDRLTTMLMIMLTAKRSGVQLDRDLIFLAEAGEESTPAVGIDFMVREHFEEIDAEFAITEGGGGSMVDGKVHTLTIGTAEKIPRRARLISNGSSGHGSVPRLDNALIHLSAAVAKVGTWETPMRLNDTTRTYFERLAGIGTPEQKARYNGLANPSQSAGIQRYLAANEPQHYSMLRTSVVPTMLKAGIGPNVIPSEAEATLDIRALPDEDMPKFLEAMNKVISDPAVRIEPIPNSRPASPAMRLDTEMYRALENSARRMYPGVTVMPVMGTGATDMAQIRAKGVLAYGIGPVMTDTDRINYGAHSDVERLPEASLYPMVEFAWNAVMEVAAAR